MLDLSSEDVRKRLSPAGLKALSRIAKVWDLSDDEVRQLAGIGLLEAAHDLSAQPEQDCLTADQLYRISCLASIYQAIHVLHTRKLADKWISLSNRNIIFGGASPLTYMIEGGIAAMCAVRRMLDARCQGQ